MGSTHWARAWDVLDFPVVPAGTLTEAVICTVIFVISYLQLSQKNLNFQPETHRSIMVPALIEKFEIHSLNQAKAADGPPRASTALDMEGAAVAQTGARVSTLVRGQTTDWGAAG